MIENLGIVYVPVVKKIKKCIVTRQGFSSMPEIVKFANPLNEVWIAGKGPSLDTFDWSKAGVYRFGINETAFIIPFCFGTFAIDYHILNKYKKSLNSNIIVFRKFTHIDYEFPRMFLWDRNMMKDAHATLCIAIQVLHHLGARKFHFIGCDSMNQISGYAKSIININGQGDNKDSYRTINQHIQDTLIRLKVEVIWEHQSL